ncbi:chemotaxis protein CheA [Sedimentibacter hydroxybenzoicus DSM 7310]|uniref:Chemotaxis protein CheA n=1 Tax=Sedimentibacter hydroxybenzoicus DSM 7310 TaxID=1123245 RepID=A0A974GUS6_SEDHY|nr:chemotaxis protein CheA [Sedimentibacter hydroxybenzoicus]NYB72623.1 chemotaxis protein CheA [Sedimentibacter hydroxybenzoicus DSM 7310]
MDNNFDSVLDMYLFEANSLLEQLDDILLRAEHEQAFDKECIDEIFRIMHTIKGSSAMMQFNSIMTISHKVEDLFYYIREKGINSKYNEQLVNLVFKFTDFIKDEISKIEDGQELEENLEPFEKEIIGFLNVISGQVPENNLSKDEAALTQSTALLIDEIIEENDEELISEEVQVSNRYAIKIIFDDDIGMENIRAYLIINQLRETGIDFTYKPENVERISETSHDIIKDGFFVYVNDKESLNAAVHVVREALNVKNYTVIEYTDEHAKEENTELKTDSGFVAEINKEIKNTKVDTSKHSKQSLITVNLTKLDKLVNIVGELVIAESMVSSDNEIKKLNLDSFTKSTRQMRKLTDELQDIVMSLRMVPVSGIFQKMKRIVRDMGKELNKEVELVLIGEDTEIDKTIVDGISDPIMHLVRNAMDHGIESEDERIKLGKSRKGMIRLSASNTGGEIHITVEDDGKGFDYKKILAKAKAKDMLTKPEGEYTPKEIFQFIMQPGFSTNEAVTEYSGRGVGMDVVKSNVEKVGGNVVLDSKEGFGTIVTFKIPLTLTIVSGMQVVVGDSEFIIPIKNIQQSFKTSETEIIHNTDGREMILIREKCYPIVRVNEYFGIKTESTNVEDGILILVESGDGSICLFVDSIIGEQQVVVKPLPTILNKNNLKETGISGCSILGDGSINLILDIGNIIESM